MLEVRVKDKIAERERDFKGRFDCRLHNANADRLWVYCRKRDQIIVHIVNHFPTKNCQILFFWPKKLCPITQTKKLLNSNDCYMQELMTKHPILIKSIFAASHWPKVDVFCIFWPLLATFSAPIFKKILEGVNITIFE